MRKDESSFALQNKAWLLIPALFLSVSMVLGAVEAPGSHKSFRSSSGNFLVVSDSRPEAVSLARWVEEVMQRLEKLLGEKLPFDRRHYFQVITYAEPLASQEQVVLTERTLLEQRVPTIIYYDFFNLRRESAMQGLCELLLKEMVRRRRELLPEDRRGESAVPGWLIGGVSQNLFVADKGRNSRYVYRQWKSGTAFTVSAVMADGEKGEGLAAEGVFVGWLLSFPSETPIMGRILGRIAESAVTRDWLSAELAKLGMEGDLDNAWDFWIFGQKNRIYELGRLDRELVDELRAELLILEGTYGSSWGSGKGSVLTFADLIAMRDEDWVAGFSRKKAGDIQMLGFGKAKEFMEVAGMYVEFLNALAEGKAGWRLRGMLKKADKAFEKMESRFDESERAFTPGR